MKKPLIKLVALITSMALMGNAVVYGYETEKPVLENIDLNQEVDRNNEIEPNTQSGDFEYEVLDDGTVSLTKYTGQDEIPVIPSEIDGKDVTKIGDRAFYKCGTITYIVIPESVTSIGRSAFSGCKLLNSIEIPDTKL